MTVHIQYDGTQAQLAKQPLVPAQLHALGAGLIKPLEQAHDGFVPSRFAPAKQAYRRAIQARDVGMHKARGPTPDAHDHLLDELLDELLGCIPPVGAGLWQIPALHDGFEAQAI